MLKWIRHKQYIYTNATTQRKPSIGERRIKCRYKKSKSKWKTTNLDSLFESTIIQPNPHLTEHLAEPSHLCLRWFRLRCIVDMLKQCTGVVVPKRHIAIVSNGGHIDRRGVDNSSVPAEVVREFFWRHSYYLIFTLPPPEPDAKLYSVEWMASAWREFWGRVLEYSLPFRSKTT